MWKWEIGENMTTEIEWEFTQLIIDTQCEAHNAQTSHYYLLTVDYIYSDWLEPIYSYKTGSEPYEIYATTLQYFSPLFSNTSP